LNYKGNLICYVFLKTFAINIFEELQKKSLFLIELPVNVKILDGEFSSVSSVFIIVCDPFNVKGTNYLKKKNYNP